MSTANPLPRAAQAAPQPPVARPAGPTAAPAQQRAPAAAQPAAQPAAQAGAPAAAEEAHEEGADSSKFILFNAVPSWSISAVVHLVVVLVMALITMETKAPTVVMQVVAAPTEVQEEIDELQEEAIKINVEVTTTSETSSEVMEFTQDVVATPTEVTVANDVDAAAIQVELSDFGEQTAPKNDLMQTVGSFSGSGVSGRGAAVRGQMVAKYGGTEASEAAVAAALEWFANHQMPNGGWSYDHRTGPCAGRCGDAGSLTDCYTGATAMALLPFLGAGQTHKEGKYRGTVERGLYFLVSQMKVKGNAGDLAQSGGSMYSHGLASIVLCEAYAMTHDKGLMAPAQLSLNHIVYAQDPVGGGWRYSPRQPGDTSVVGWQLMALKSGHMAYLVVPPQTIQGAVRFLDSVQSESGARYGYTGPGGGQATTAVGLLCRMYLGWKKDHPGIERGVEYLSKTGPSKGNMYYNYYATQVMRHYEGEMWDKWNKELRDHLVNSQDKNGHQKGSWHLRGDHGSERGGRVYTTSMATMILEVYYRHMPIYGKQAAADDFPL